MAKINSQTKIELSVGGALFGAAVLSSAIIGCGWAMFTALRADIAESRASIETLVRESSVTATKVQVLDAGVNSEVKSIADQYELLSSKLTENGLTLVALSTRLDQSIARQQEFERYVISRISADASLQDSTPPGWIISEKSVLEKIKEGSSPLDNWQRFTFSDGKIREGDLAPQEP